MFAIFICYNTWLLSCDGETRGTLWIGALTHGWCLVDPYNLHVTLESYHRVQIHSLSSLRSSTLCSSPNPLCPLFLKWQSCSQFYNLLSTSYLAPVNSMCAHPLNSPLLRETVLFLLRQPILPCSTLHPSCLLPAPAVITSTSYPLLSFSLHWLLLLSLQTYSEPSILKQSKTKPSSTPFTSSYTLFLPL